MKVSGTGGILDLISLCFIKTLSQQIGIKQAALCLSKFILDLFRKDRFSVQGTRCAWDSFRWDLDYFELIQMELVLFETLLN